jgi:hypothetical protein
MVFVIVGVIIIVVDVTVIFYYCPSKDVLASNMVPRF